MSARTQLAHLSGWSAVRFDWTSGRIYTSAERRAQRMRMWIWAIGWYFVPVAFWLTAMGAPGGASPLVMSGVAALSLRWHVSPKRTNQLVHAILFLSFLSAYGCCWFGGGIRSASVLWLGLVPTVAGFMGEREHVLPWGALLLVSLVVLAFAHHGGHLPPALPDLLLPTSVWFNTLFPIGLAVLTGAVLNHSLNDAESQLRDRRERLAHARGALEDALGERTRMLDALSHELRTPMNAISLAGQDLVHAGEHGLASNLQGQVQHLTALTDTLLNGSRVLAFVAQRPIPIHVGHALEELVAAETVRADELNRTLVVYADPSLPIGLSQDPAFLHGTLRPRLLAALEDGRPGPLCVDVRWEPHPTLPQVTFHIRSHGAAPPTPHAPVTPACPGTDRLAQSLGGAWVSAATPTDHTHTLTLTADVVDPTPWCEAVRPTHSAALNLAALPAWQRARVQPWLTAWGVPEATEGLARTSLPDSTNVRVAALAHALEQAPPTSDPPPTRVLIVDDQELNLRIAARMTQRLGREAITVLSGAEALAILADDAPDVALVLMDIRMPDMDGVQTTQHIRQLQSVGHTVPVVALTAETAPESVHQMLQAGMQGHLAKPLSLERLAKVLDTYVPHALVEA